MIRFVSSEINGIGGATHATFAEMLTVEVSYGKYKQKVTLPVTNLTIDQLTEELRMLNKDMVEKMRNWEKIEQTINLS